MATRYDRIAGIEPGQPAPAPRQASPLTANYQPAQRDMALRSLATQPAPAPTNNIAAAGKLGIPAGTSLPTLPNGSVDPKALAAQQAGTLVDSGKQVLTPNGYITDRMELPPQAAPAAGTPQTAMPTPATGGTASGGGGAFQMPSMPQLQTFLGHHPEVMAFVQQVRSLTDPAQRQALIDQFHSQIDQWKDDLKQQMDQENPGRGPRDRGRGDDFSNAWDGFDQQDAAAAASAPVAEAPGGDFAEAARLRRVRQSRQSGAVG